MRLSYARSCVQLQKAGYLDPGPIPPIPKRMPKFDDPEPLGVNFFRTHIENARFDNLTLARTFFGRSEFVGVSFKNSDVSESNFCWNDFTKVDFTDATLELSDLRSSTFTKTLFIKANLKKADLRRSEFEGCSFEGANLEGAVVHDRQKAKLHLSEAQVRQAVWTKDDGAEPGGG
jgi:BTB/POZ domain-containing protein KCTD9